MKRYTLSVEKPEYWNEIHNALIVDSNKDGIPDRQITCTDSKDHSPTRGTYELTEEEAAEIATHPHVKWIELSPSDNPDAYPKPTPATKRFRQNVKIYRDLDSGYGPPATNPTSAEDKRTNWAVKRVGVEANSDLWPNVFGNPPPISDDVSYSLTGKNVDIVIHDSGVLQYHPEFLDANGQSRVRDIVLDGPFYMDPNYFISNNLTYTKPDGRIGITTSSAHAWWNFTSSRSPAFQSEGTVYTVFTITVPRSMGDNLDGTNDLISGHGTAAAGLAAGKYMGLAFEANIWNMPAISDNVGMTIERSYDYLKIWHRNKPTNPETGRPNPTVINGSWGHVAGFLQNHSVNYKFRGETGAFFGSQSTGAGPGQLARAMKNGLISRNIYWQNSIVRLWTWSTSSRSNSTDTAADEMMAEGVIYVAAAGNNNQRLGIGANDPDRLNYMDDVFIDLGDPRPEIPGLACPCGHRDWMNPQGIGFDSATDFHPVICVGAMDDYISLNSAEIKAFYSNNGPGIDVWAPADETLSPGTNGVSDYEDYQRYDDGRFYDTSFNGTSAASPVAAGVIALYMEMNPTATSRQVKEWLKVRGSRIVNSYQDLYTDDTTVNYWSTQGNLRGAEKRILHDETANDTIPKINGLDITGVSFSQS